MLPSVVIVSPALAGANNGNWQTVRRWEQLLAASHRVRISQHWPDAHANADTEPQGDHFMLALHARRSADAIAAWAQAQPGRGLAVVLTGTDLYSDIQHDPLAQHSLRLAQQLVVLQDRGLAALPEPLHAKARVIYQSTTARQPLAKSRRLLRAVMVGHLREVKSPQTLFEAARLLRTHHDIHIDHIGEASEPRWAEQALATQHDCPNYRWLGALPHALTRRRIQGAHVLIHTSAMEGGAHVIMEAVRSGTPVLASRVDGNIGMLGMDYEGYFKHGDAAELAGLLMRCRTGQQLSAAAAAAPWLERLRAQCDQRAPLFTEETEHSALLELLSDLRSQ